MENFDGELQLAMLARLLAVFPSALPVSDLIGQNPSQKQMFNYIYARDKGWLALVRMKPDEDQTVRLTADGIDVLRKP